MFRKNRLAWMVKMYPCGEIDQCAWKTSQTGLLLGMSPLQKAANECLPINFSVINWGTFPQLFKVV
jgi:hypothetical protein